MKTGTFRLWLRTDKPNKRGAYPIHLIYSISGKRQYINTGVVVYLEQWNDGEVMAMPPSIGRKKYNLKIYEMPNREDAKRDNQTIIDTINTIKTICDRYRLDGITYTSEMIKAEFNKIRYPEKVEKVNNNFCDFINKYIVNNEGNRNEASLKVYRNLLKRLRNYNEDVTFDTVDYDFFAGFQQHLIQSCNLANISVAKQISTAKMFLNLAIKKGIPVNNTFKAFQTKKDTDLEVIALTQLEFDMLFDLDLSGNKRLDAIRDVFLFSCSTGMRYSDLAQLRHHHIKTDYVLQSVAKTKQQLQIPLNKYSLAILEKYKDAPRPLPVISNQKSNEALHDLCKLAGIIEQIEIVRYKGAKRVVEVYPKHELITMHTGRKSFCTLSLEKGMSAEQVMSISGHKDYKSFKRYVNVTSTQSKKAMQAWNK